LASAVVAPSQASFSGRNGEIAYSVGLSVGDCSETVDCFDSVVRLLNARTGAVKTVPSCRSEFCSETTPAWSPDGRTLAFLRERPDSADTVLANPDGTAKGTASAGFAPAWSPDGTEFASTQSFDSPRCCARPKEIIVNAVNNYENRRRLTFRGGQDADWSSRGLIAFSRLNGAGSFNLYTITPSGSGLRRLTFRGGESASWAPDGRRLVFTRSYRVAKGKRREELAIIGHRGGRVRRLTFRGGSSPVWSPDGKKIAFVRGSRLLVLDLASRRLKTIRRESTEDVGGLDWRPLNP